jgi:hypothetical protein
MNNFKMEIGQFEVRSLSQLYYTVLEPYSTVLNCTIQYLYFVVQIFTGVNFEHN